MLRAFIAPSELKEYHEGQTFLSPSNSFFAQSELELIWWKELGKAFKGLFARLVKRAALIFLLFVSITGGFFATVGYAEAQTLHANDVQCLGCIVSCEKEKCAFSV